MVMFLCRMQLLNIKYSSWNLLVREKIQFGVFKLNWWQTCLISINISSFCNSLKVLVCVRANACTANFHHSEFWLHNKSWKCWPRSNRFNKHSNRFWHDILMHRKLRSSKARQQRNHRLKSKRYGNVIDRQKSKFLIDWIQIPENPFPMMECSIRLRRSDGRNESPNICFEFVNLQGKRMNRKNRCSFTFSFISVRYPDAFDVCMFG